MSRYAIWLHVAGLRQYLVCSALVGAISCWVGARVTPVPAQLFADVDGVPLVYLGPLVIAVSLAQWRPPGSLWFETSNDLGRVLGTTVAGLAIAFLPPLLTSPATEVCRVAGRNGTLLAAAVLLLRPLCSAAATSTVLVVASTAVWSFGWSLIGEPQPWALILAPSSAPVPLGCAVAVAAIAAVRLRRPMRS